MGERTGTIAAGVYLQGRGVLLLGIALLLTVATRSPFLPQHLFSFDSVNFALALKEFDPARHQPQPPGYPFYVAEARAVYQLAGTPTRTTAILKIAVTYASVALLYLLGCELFSVWVGLLAAALLFVNPAFWYAGLTSAPRLHLALISLLVAYFCWRAGHGDQRGYYIASVILGLGGGFRPELSLFLLPLWLWTAWQCGRKKLFLRGSLLFLAGTACWVVVLLAAYGGPAQMFASFRQYLTEQSQSVAALAGAPTVEWRRMVGRAFLWNGLGMLPWVWTVPLLWRQRQRFTKWSQQWLFLTIWFFPAFLFHSLVHIGESGHALVTIPALCLVGGVCILEAQQFLTRRRGESLLPAGFFAGIALLGNAVLFFWPYALPERKDATQFRGWASLRDAVSVGTWETSYARVCYVAHTTDLALNQIDDLQAADGRPVLLLWNRDAVPVWRKVTYYYPSTQVLEFSGKRTAQPRARLWRGTEMLASHSGPPRITLPVPKNGRLIWLVHPDSVSELSNVVPLQGSFPAYYTDLGPDSPGFRWGAFDFLPQ